MADVITETDIRKFAGMSRAVMPAGAILTPSAKDWALEHHLTIVFEHGTIPGTFPASGGENEKVSLLRQVVESVVKKLNQNGTPVTEDVLVPIVVACLERMGHQVK